MKDALPLAPAPELIIGLVGPIGVDLDLAASLLTDALRDVGYETSSLRITQLMREVPTGLNIDETPYIASFRSRIAYANKVCELLDRSDAMAILAISAIRQIRREKAGDPETPIEAMAYIIRQFKRPSEVKLLRSVYGRQFVQISVYAPQQDRIDRIALKERASRGGLVDEADVIAEAHKLVMQDDKEADAAKDFGQNVQDAFPLGDVFINAVNRPSCKATIDRFVQAFFGNNEITPTHDEYGMYIAKSASLRSAALGRQVGAAIFSTSDDVITIGCNEVPKAGGGTYWSEDLHDQRDIIQGYDPNEQRKSELLVDLLDRLMNEGHLSNSLTDLGDAYSICKALLSDESLSTIKESRVMDLLEFGRDIHAEMSAICDAARKGVSLLGAKLYTTTFPCHLCAKHIVAAGISKVVYMEPYPKSYARQLHTDSIQVERIDAADKVAFVPFIGIAPNRYRDIFEKGRRKYGGVAQTWNRGQRRPMIEVYYPSYFRAEIHVVTLIQEKLG
jgi:deoxycytidylate deaminase